MYLWRHAVLITQILYWPLKIFLIHYAYCICYFFVVMVNILFGFIKAMVIVLCEI